MRKRIVFLPGDGVGEEVSRGAMKVLRHVAEEYELEIESREFAIGGACLDKHGIPVQEETIAACKNADAVFLGAVGGPEWDKNPAELRPEIALLRLRKELALFTNLRPVKVFSPLAGASSLKPEYVQGVDLLVVRELTGGIYFGQPKFTESIDNGERAVDTMAYSTPEIERIARVAFEAAMKRRKKVTSVDKANILVTSRLWRKTVTRIAEDYPHVELEHLLVDNCAMQLVKNPRQFDVILTGNMFGDVLSDEASMLTGSLGMLPSASLGTGVGLYEPVHGSAPDIAGKNIANPLAAIASVALMFHYSFNMENAAQTIEKAIEKVLKVGFRTADLTMNGHESVSTSEMTDEVIRKIDAQKNDSAAQNLSAGNGKVYWLLETMSLETS